MLHHRRNVLPTQLTHAYIACMLTIYLLWPGIEGYEAITQAKCTLFFLLSGSYLVLLAAVVLLSGRPEHPQPLSAAARRLLIYGAFTLVSCLLSKYPAVAFGGGSRREGFVTIAVYLALFFAVSRYARPGRWMLYLSGASVSVFCIICLLQLAGFNPFYLYPGQLDYYDAGISYSGQFLGTVGNAGFAAALLCLALPAFVCALVRLDGRRRFYLLIPTALCIATLLWMRISAGIVGILGTVLIALPVCTRSNQIRRAIVIAEAALCTAALLAIYALGSRLSGTLYEFSELLHGRADLSFGSGRLMIWRECLSLFIRRPLFGGGADTLLLYFDEQFTRYNAATGETIRASIDAAHNEYLNILVNQGLLALLSYLAALVSSLLRWMRSARRIVPAAICGCAVVGYSIAAFFGISMCICTPYFILSWALLERTLCKEANP